MATEGSTIIVLESVYKTVPQDKNKKSVSGRKTFEYQSQFNLIFENDLTVNPENTLSSNSSRKSSKNHAADTPAKRVRCSNTSEIRVDCNIEQHVVQHVGMEFQPCRSLWWLPCPGDSTQQKTCNLDTCPGIQTFIYKSD